MNVDALFAGVVGQDQAVARLVEAAAAPVHAYLLAGPPGSGKSQAARAFAAALLCPYGGDGTCRDCRLALAGEHPDVREVERTGPAITIDQAAGDHDAGIPHAGGGRPQGARSCTSSTCCGTRPPPRC